MKVTPVLFEDHSLTHFRPLAWSLPTFEFRVGMFSLRERVGQLFGGTDQKGILLGRPILDGLQMASGWAVGASAAGTLMMDEDRVFIWINGRAAWNPPQLEDLLKRVATGEAVCIEDDLGLLAFSCSPELSRKTLASWSAWEKDVAEKHGWATPNSEVPTWQPDISTSAEPGQGLQWIWEIVPQTPAALFADLEAVKGGVSFSREPFGMVCTVENVDPVWARTTQLSPATKAGLFTDRQKASIKGLENFWCGPEVILGYGVAIDATDGPVILDRNVTIMPNSYLAGPLYIGPGSTVKAGSTIYGESSFGIGNKIAGEIGESTFGDFSNKQHDGFIGHAVLGSWVNLGAMTTCSDLKNNYGNVRVDLGLGQVDSGQRFVGLLMGDHAKTAIGTLFNTGTCVGFASNIFGGGMPPKFVGNFRWGGQEDCPAYAVDRALDTAEVVMSRRGCQLTDAHGLIFKSLAD